MDPVIDIAPEAADDPLAQRLAEVVRENVRDPAGRREFDRLRGSFSIVTDDVGGALTLRFDFGRLTIHEGLVGVPDVTIRGTSTDIDALTELPFGSRLKWPRVSRAGLTDWLGLAGKLRGKQLKIYGMISHTSQVFRLLRVLSSAR